MNIFDRLRSTIPRPFKSIKSTTATTTTTRTSFTIGGRLFHTSLPRRTQSQIKLSLGPTTLNIQFHPNEAIRQFPYTWLRDSDPQLIHPATRQKLHLSSQIPTSATSSPPLEAGLVKDGTCVKIVWASLEEEGEPEDSLSDGILVNKEGWPDESEFPIEMLKRYSNSELNDAFRHAIKPMPWSKDTLLRSSTDLTMSYTGLCSSMDTLRRGIEQLLRYGILFVEGVPHEETSDERCEMVRLAGLFGLVRETIYGRFWDVVSRGESSRNVAYTNLSLGMHMDLAYCENPPRYQVLHMLRNDVIGGESLFSDGLEGAYRLGEMVREAFDVLCERTVAFHYLNEHHHLYREHRTIQLASSSVIPSSSSSAMDRPTSLPEVAYINYSPPFQAPLPLTTASDPRFLPALRKFSRFLHSPDQLFERVLTPGMAVIFDNRRVLHGRRGFRNGITGGDGARGEGRDEDGVRRWLKGCYLEGDVLLDRLRVIRDGRVPTDAKGYVS